jgi:hypothetical protein
VPKPDGNLKSRFGERDWQGIERSHRARGHRPSCRYVLSVARAPLPVIAKARVRKPDRGRTGGGCRRQIGAAAQEAPAPSSRERWAEGEGREAKVSVCAASRLNFETS